MSKRITKEELLKRLKHSLRSLELIHDLAIRHEECQQKRLHNIKFESDNSMRGLKDLLAKTEGRQL